MNDTLKSVICHIVNKLGRVDGRTRLMKLVYLVDLEAAKKLGHPVTGAKFYGYKHGPFSREVMDAIDELKGIWIHESAAENIYGDRTYSYRLTDSPFVDPFSIEDPEVGTIVDRVLDKWGRRDLTALLRHIYETKPFTDRTSNNRVDFALVAHTS